MIKRLLLLPILIVSCSAYAAESGGGIESVAQTVKGDVAIGLAYLIPQGDFADNANDGGQILGRLTSRKTGITPLSLWLTGSASFFGEHSKMVSVVSPDDPSGYVEAKRRIEEYVFSFYLGPQVGSPSRRAFLRPRAGVGLGFNTFITDSHYYWGNLPTEEDGSSSEIDQVLGRWGWRGVAGVDIFLSGKRGAFVDLSYDQVWHFDLTDGPAGFLGIRAGLVWTFD